MPSSHPISEGTFSEERGVNRTVLLAPVLRAEKWTSIDLHRANTLEAFEKFAPDWKVLDIGPDEKLADSKIGKRLLRDVIYPLQTRAKARDVFRKDGKRPLLHVIDHSYGHLCAAWRPSVITCHDLNHFVRPDLQGLALYAWRWRVKLMTRAAHIFTVSGHLAEEVKKHLHLPGSRISVAYNGVDGEVFRKRPLEEAEAAFPQIAAWRKTHHLVLNIGSNADRKNMPTLLQAVAVLKHEFKLPVKLLKVGNDLREDGYQSLIEQLAIADEVIDLGVLRAEQVSHLCNLAHALSFPSLYEGFGRPTLEAQACELPCVLSNASCMKEVGGEGALYHDGKDFHQLASHLKLIFTDENVRQHLIAEGLKNASQFTWEAHVRKLISVYREIA